MAKKGSVIQSVLSLRDELSNGLARAAKNAKKTSTQITKDMTGAARQIDVWGKKAAAAIDNTVKKLGGLALEAGKAFTAFAFQTGMDFEAGLSKVQATGQLGADQMAALEAKAREVASSTRFALSETAEALNYFAQAGWDDVKMIAALPDAVNLSIATDTNIAETSSIITNTMSALKMAPEGFTEVMRNGVSESVGNVQHLADVIAAAASNSNTSASLLGGSLQQVGTLAGALHYSIDEVAVALGLMANVGVQGSSAGMMLKNAFNNLLSPSEKAAAAMERYDISIARQDGSAKTLIELMRDLRESLGELDVSLSDTNGEIMDGETLMESLGSSAVISAEQMDKIRAVAEIFGMRALPGMLGIIQASPDDFDKLTSAMANCTGVAQNMANTMADNLTGDIAILQSAASDAGWVFYSALGDNARTAVQRLTNVITTLVENGTIETWANRAGKAFHLAIEAVSAAFQWCADHADGLKIALETLLALFVADKILKFAQTAQNAILTVSNGFSLLSVLAGSSGLGSLGAVFGKLGTAFGGLGTVIGKLAHPFQTVLGLFGRLSGLFSAIAGGGLASILPLVAMIAGLIAAGILLYQNWDAVKEKALALWAQLKTNLQPAFEAIQQAAASVSAFFMGVVVPAVSTLWGKIKELAGSLMTAMTPAAGVALVIFSQLADFFVDAIIPTISNVIVIASQFVSTLLEAVTPAVNAVVAVLSMLADLFSSVVIPAVGAVITIIEALTAKLLSVLLPVVSRIWNAFSGFATCVATAVVQAFGGLSKAVTDLISLFLSKFQPAIDKIRQAFDKVKNAISGLMDKVKGFLGMDTNKTINVKTVYDGGAAGYNAAGAAFWHGGPTWIHEQGGEIIELPNRRTIIPANLLSHVEPAAGDALSEGRKTLVNLPRGTRIIPHAASVRLLQTSFPDAGHNAAGTAFWRGGPTWIHEQGGEIIRLPDTRTLIPQDIIPVALSRTESAAAPAAISSVIPSVIQTGVQKISKTVFHTAARNAVSSAVNTAINTAANTAIHTSINTVRAAVSQTANTAGTSHIQNIFDTADTVHILKNAVNHTANTAYASQIANTANTAQISNIGHSAHTSIANLTQTRPPDSIQSDAGLSDRAAPQLPSAAPGRSENAPSSGRAAQSPEIHISVHVDTVIGEKKYIDHLAEQIARPLIRALGNI